MEKHLLKLKRNMVRSIVAEDRAAKMGYIEIPLAAIPFKNRNEASLVQTQNGLFLYALKKMVLPMTHMRDTDPVVKY